MNNRFLIMGAQAVSLLFSPFYLPVVAFALLLVFSYLHLLPLSYKMLLLAIVYAFTVLVPRFSIFVYRKVNKLTHFQLGHRRNRFIPYLLSIISYVCLLHVMRCMHMPNFTLGIIVAALSIQVVCALLNLRTKVSTHSAAAGGVVGALMGFSFIFVRNAGWCSGVGPSHFATTHLGRSGAGRAGGAALRLPGRAAGMRVKNENAEKNFKLKTQ